MSVSNFSIFPIMFVGLTLLYNQYSLCKGSLVTPVNGDKLNYKAFTPGQKAVMFSNFIKLRRNSACASAKARRLLPPFPSDFYKRQEKTPEHAALLADLLLNNCSVAIQDVFQKDTIPLPPSVLESVSIAAVSLKANPPTYTDPNVQRPATMTIGPGALAATGGPSPGQTIDSKVAESANPTSTSTSPATESATGTATGTGSKNAGNMGYESRSGGAIFAMVGWIAGVLVI
jgi:hypothetical protein